MQIPGSKTTVPELPREYIARPALREELEGTTAAQVTVLSAPAGYGKTLLLADWVSSGGPPTAWVTLDTDDNDPQRLWGAVVTALRALPTVQLDVLDRVDQQASPDGGEFVDRLVEQLEQLEQPVRLILDDVQELTGTASLRGLARLVRRRPAALRLVLASRADPPISLPRLRLEGRLHELRADRLRFSVDDTDKLQRASGLDLTPSQVGRLHARTEGWVAGLRLAMLALRRADDSEGFLANFSGDEHSVADYLTGEILDALPSDTQDFLGAVSICSPLPAALAAALSERPDADHLLDELGRDTALVERTAPGVHRIHALLRSYLVADLERNHPDQFRHRQTTAARWWADRHERVHALRHAVRAGDRALLLDLLHSWGVPLLVDGALEPLSQALAAVERGSDPWPALLAVITDLDQHHAVSAAAAELRHARRTWPAMPDPELEVLRESSELRAAAAGIGDAEPIPVGTDERVGPDLRALLYVSRGNAALANPAGGSAELARNELERALELARANDFAYLEAQSLSMLASLAAVVGDNRGMVSAAQAAVATAVRHGRHPSAWSSGAVAMLAYAALLAGNPAAARAYADSGLDGSDRLPPDQLFILHAVRGCAVADQGERSAGLAEARAGRAAFGGTPSSVWLSVALAVLEHRLALLHGNARAAEEVATWLGKRTDGLSESSLLRAWAEMAAGRTGPARAALARLHDSSVPALLPHATLEALLLDTELALQAGDELAGRTALAASLTLGEELDVLRPFALAWPRTGELLDERPAGVSPGFAARVASARAAVHSAADPLITSREMAVLEWLPSLLTASEIADEFTLSVNTVKSHIRSIYAKLGASNRRDAVQRAFERGLLP